MIYYPISTLMLAGIREILIITTPDDQPSFQKLLGDGSDWGITLKYEVQQNPEGLAQAYIIAEKFLDNDQSMMVLGDNIFHGAGLGSELGRNRISVGAEIFTYEVSNPSHYGILNLDPAGKPTSVVEKPTQSVSKLAVTGLYTFDNRVCEMAKEVKPSARGELEITSLINRYLEMDELHVTHLSRGTAWLDTGNPEAMHDAASYIRVIEDRTGLKIACLEEIAFRSGWIDESSLKMLTQRYKGNSYGRYLERILSS
jgi:glucose-1-phosphate thymidylyltransferase